MTESTNSRPCWFGGTLWNEADDQTERFLSEGIWENGYEDAFLEEVKSIQPGDKIALKAAFTQKNNLPFDNRGQTVSVMRIKAIGTVIENLQDGHTVKVDWQRLNPPRDWYFHTGRTTLWRVDPTESWKSQALLDFTFNDKPQEIDSFVFEYLITSERWNELILRLVREFCAKYGSNIFRKKDFIRAYKHVIEEAFPENKSIDASVSICFNQYMRDNILERLSRGNYRLITEPDALPTNWRDNIFRKINLLCSEKSSAYFTRQEFLDRYLSELAQEFPQNNTIASTVSRILQEMRDAGLLEFVNSGIGEYKWLQYGGGSAYTLNNILEEGCFLERHELEAILDRLREKKNLVLQGPPGTGKTWLAKKLAFALVGACDAEKVRAVQFHPSLSYEDFIRGWRPAGDGKLELVDGPFLEMVKTAKSSPEETFVLVIEEINRGNPAQVLGEMLTLLEADKRNPASALELSYSKDGDKRVYIPENLYVIGTMNIADRSLALVDLALRRRFAFCDLEPRLGTRWTNWMATKFGFDLRFLNSVAKRLENLNEQIESDNSLGRQFRIGHSFVTLPANAERPQDPEEWFRRVVETEIGPLLEEYWFDHPAKAGEAKKQLLGSD